MTKKEETRIISCQDGGKTIYREDIKEAYHSNIGPGTEARKKYVEPARIEEIKEPVRILDVCFGLGYNTDEAITEAKKQGKKIKITALEKDPWIIKQITNKEFKHKNKELLTKLINNYDEKEKKAQIKEKNIEITLIIGDARRTIKKIREEHDIIFFDPFSPKKQPHMWSQEFIKNIAKKCAPKGKLLTYSCAKSIRKKLEKAGFSIKDGPVVGRRGPSTIAIKKETETIKK